MQDAIENLNKKLMGLTKSNSDLLQQLGEREKQIQKLGSLLAQGPNSTEKSFCLSFGLKNCLSFGLRFRTMRKWRKISCFLMQYVY